MRTYTQSQHEAINRREYPGTRQLCVICDEPTERCEDDGIWCEDPEGWICAGCEEDMMFQNEKAVKILNDLEREIRYIEGQRIKKVQVLNLIETKRKELEGV